MDSKNCQATSILWSGLDPLLALVPHSRCIWTAALSSAWNHIRFQKRFLSLTGKEGKSQIIHSFFIPPDAWSSFHRYKHISRDYEEVINSNSHIKIHNAQNSLFISHTRAELGCSYYNLQYVSGSQSLTWQSMSHTHTHAYTHTDFTFTHELKQQV